MSASAFFYGTLMCEPVLSRVIGRDASTLPQHKALLEGHVRKRIKGMDYPAVIKAPENTANSVLGVYASSLTEMDIKRLDLFEGEEYTRRNVTVKLLEGDEKTVQTQTYIYKATPADLEEGEWDFEAFKRDKLDIWAGKSADGGEGTGGRGIGGDIWTSVSSSR
ncbi:hypothetical protein K470DRAFT_255217 [Piedraia hortae CBS 480.64]|uniref:Putative gamma-glutamylcyclotransferase n=1 Tax=Piedraia hortae CBS 480.64 TaxID=1314780 RepID=A0A6A7C6M5_9PEZI|nr:hypothetical protein K470DRAFT_255217 [Piedraia hortae CBS 480.64]